MRRLFAFVFPWLGAAALSASAQELIRNGAFDHDLAQWTSQWASNDCRWASDDDANGSSGSGAAVTGCYCVGPMMCTPGSLSQCVPVRPGGTYRLSVSEHDIGGGHLTAEWYSSSVCTSDALSPAEETDFNNGHWTSWESALSAPSTAHSLKLTMQARGGASYCGTAVWDDVSLQVVTEPPAAKRTVLIPTAANARGLYGDHFKTRLTLLSFGSALPSSVQIQVLPQAGKDGRLRTIALSPGVTTTLDDFLGEVGYDGGAAIQVTYPEDQPLYITAEVYADSTAGRYTTVVPVISDPLNDRRILTPGIRNNSTSRTNLGCSSVVDGTYVVRAEIHAADNSALGVLSLAVPPHGWVQTPVPFPVSDGYVLWSSLWPMPGPPTGLSCFAVLVDNATNDGSVIR